MSGLRAWDLVNYLKGEKRVLDTRFFARDMSASQIKAQILARGEEPPHPETGRPTNDFLVRRNKP